MWWELKITQTHEKTKLNEADKEHIANCIKEGFTSGDIVED